MIAYLPRGEEAPSIVKNSTTSYRMIFDEYERDNAWDDMIQWLQENDENHLITTVSFEVTEEKLSQYVDKKVDITRYRTGRLPDVSVKETDRFPV